MVNIASGHGNSQKGLKKFLFWQTSGLSAHPAKPPHCGTFPNPFRLNHHKINKYTLSQIWFQTRHREITSRNNFRNTKSACFDEYRYIFCIYLIEITLLLAIVIVWQTVPTINPV
jgi:hypothetical protein